MVKKHLSKIIHTVLSYLLLELSSAFKFNHLVGSQRLFFSAINCTGPLVGFRGIGAFALLLLRRYFFSTPKVLNLAYTAGVGFFNPLLYHIPTLIASGYWFSSNRIIRLFVPILCMALFIGHPIGSQVFFYSLYWLIPVAIHFLPKQIVFFEALGTTFVAHAIGSVLWLYIVPMPQEYWIGLVPIVIVERLLFASGMVLVYYLVQGIKHFNKPTIFIDNFLQKKISKATVN